MARNVIAVILGIVVAGFIIFSVQQINYQLFPLPEEISIDDREAMLRYVESLPPLAFVIVLLSYLLGTAIGCLTALKIANSHFFTIFMIIAFFLLIMSIINILNIPHPLWFILINLIIYVPTALIIHKLFSPKASQ